MRTTEVSTAAREGLSQLAKGLFENPEACPEMSRICYNGQATFPDKLAA
jgi:hypothetical protein